MEIKVWKAPSGVFLNIGPAQIKLTEDQYDKLWTAVYVERPSGVLWTSCFDQELADDLGYGADEIKETIHALNKSVERSFDL